MRVLIDECAPAELKFFLSRNNVECSTVPEAGWSGKTNGELLALAQREYDVFVTIDKNIPYQQNTSGLRIGIIIIRARSNRLVDLRPHFSACLEALPSAQHGQVVQVGG